MKALFLPEELFRTCIFLFIPVIGGLLIYSCKKWSYYLYLAIMTIPFIYSYLSWQSQPNQNLGAYLIAFYLINLVVVGYFVLPQVRLVYFDPRLRWWETKPRYKAEFETAITWVDKTAKGEIKNISEGGIFVQTELPINVNGRVNLNFQYNKTDHNFTGEVVYVNKNSNPTGYGISLILNESESVNLKKLIRDLSEQGTLITSRVPTDEDSFAYWFKRVVSLRKGLLPETPKKG
jgi:hypothetical protein